ncbi:hypothetical protein [Saliphagus sp. LR7]|uniref:hypothetical protein n=1 Tax=Saliphagus sp. LR7 TaxID=2282654 RepID=UPI001E455BF1|nr:hypothetical protein [Saliphagus sp. LR7]
MLGTVIESALFSGVDRIDVVESAAAHIDRVNESNRVGLSRRDAQIGERPERMRSMEDDISDLSLPVDERIEALHSRVFVPAPIEDKPPKHEIPVMWP